VAGGWSIARTKCKEYIEKVLEYFAFTQEFNYILTGVDSPLRVGKVLVPEKERYQCLVVIDTNYDPVIEVAKDGRKLIKLIKKEPLPF
jgi:hypothetical protein